MVCVCAGVVSCLPLRSCPERPGPQVVLCLGKRSDVRSGVCLCSSRYARSSRWAELVAVREREVFQRKSYRQHMYELSHPESPFSRIHIYIIYIHGEAQDHAGVLRLLSDSHTHISYRRARAGPTRFGPNAPSPSMSVTLHGGRCHRAPLRIN